MRSDALRKLVRYALTNRDLGNDDDPRLAILRDIKEATIGEGWNGSSSRRIVIGGDTDPDLPEQQIHASEDQRRAEVTVRFVVSDRGARCIGTPTDIDATDDVAQAMREAYFDDATVVLVQDLRVTIPLPDPPAATAAVATEPMTVEMPDDVRQAIDRETQERRDRGRTDAHLSAADVVAHALPPGVYEVTGDEHHRSIRRRP